MKIIFTTEQKVSSNGIDVVMYKEGDEVEINELTAKMCIEAGWAKEVKAEPVRKFEPDETPEKPKKGGRPKKVSNEEDE
jgi:hypothetical protein